MLTWVRNKTVNQFRYREHSEAAIVSCFFNPQNSEYRLKAFEKFYSTIKHMNHLILECVIGDAKPQLPENANIQRITAESLLWHKEALINIAVAKLPDKIKYVFWVDADVLFTNNNWLVEGVQELENGATILQPFEYCVHLGPDEVKPSFRVSHSEASTPDRQPEVWRSFCANFVDNPAAHHSPDYNIHGHVGFAWGALRSVLVNCPLYERALIGGADHIIAHAAAGQIPHSCIEKSFTEDLAAVYSWSKQFYRGTGGRLAYVKGDLYHLWHGDIEKRQYLKRIQEFTPVTKQIREKDASGLYRTNDGDDKYVKEYFEQREVAPGSKPTPPQQKPQKSAPPTVITKTVHHHHHSGGQRQSSQPTRDDSFERSVAMGYMTDNAGLGGLIGGNPMGGIVGASLRHSEEDRRARQREADRIESQRPHHSPPQGQGHHHNASETFS